MKALVVYYSYSGNTQIIAQELNKKLKVSIRKITVKNEKQRKYVSKIIIGGFQAISKIKPKLNEEGLDFSDYDIIYIGTPVWGGTITPAIRSFLTKYPESVKDKFVGVFYTDMGGKGKVEEKISPFLKDAKKVSFLELQFVDKNPEDNKKKACDWAWELIREKELS